MSYVTQAPIAALLRLGHTPAMDPLLEQVVTTTNANRSLFERFCRSLSAEELERPVPASAWLVRDFIAHLATIDIWVGDWFEHLGEGRRWRPTGDDGGPFNIDTWNEARVQARRSVSVEALLDEAALHRERLWAAVDRFTPEVLAQTFDFRGRTISYQRYLELWAGHDPAHAADMLRALPERLTDSELAAWTAPFMAPPPTSPAPHSL
jgi:hypothetical protein